MSGRALSPEEIWLQESEARLDSMEVLLKSVRRDIDALSEKIPSPRPSLRKAFCEEELVVHESGRKDYVLKVDSRSRAYQNLGLGSHTTREPFNDEDDIDRSKNDVPFQKSWRSPSDFRTNVSPPGSPTFGESSNIISLRDVIFHTERDLPTAQEESDRDKVIPLIDSLHSLPTIEENSQEDNTDTSLSISSDLKSADCSYGCLAQPAFCTASSDKIISLPADFQKFHATRSLDEIMSVLPECAESAQPSVSKSRSQSPFIVDHGALKYSRTSLKSRESVLSETDSFVTVNSQFFPSVEEAYITACSDADELDESNSEEPPPREERSTRKKVLVLRQTPSADGETDSEDVLEFTFVEATSCKTPNKEEEGSFSEKLSRSGDTSNDFEKKPFERLALRNQRLEDVSGVEEEDDVETSSSSTCEEAIYDTSTARLVNSDATFCYGKSPVISRPNDLCFIEEPSCLSSGLDSPPGYEDIVVHYDGDGMDVEVKETNDDNSVGIAESKEQPIPTSISFPAISLASSRDGEEGNEIGETDEKSYVPRSDSNKLYLFNNKGRGYSATTQDNIGADLITTTSLNISQTVSCQYNDDSRIVEPATTVSRIDLPQRHIDDYNRRARRDYFHIPRSSDTSFLRGADDDSLSHPNTVDRSSLDFQKKQTFRSKSVSRPAGIDNDNFHDRLVNISVREAQINATNGRMYSRSCSRYRSTDMDVALANTTVSRESLSNTSLNNGPRSKKMALSLFDLSTGQTNNLNVITQKSINSLLETDIDTGERKNQQIVLETDVDTLNTCRLVGDLAAVDQGPIQLINDKTYSLFNLTYANNTTQTTKYNQEGYKYESRADANKRAQSLSGIAKMEEAQRPEIKTGTSGLVARLRARARSNHELRIAESLTRIHVPEWLDKADLSKPIAPMNRSSSPPLPRENPTLPRNGTSLPSTSVVQNPLIHLAGTTVETVSKPTFALHSSSRSEPRHPLRPSQILRERNAISGPRLAPIKSSLRSSMKSQMKGGVEILLPATRSGLPSSSSHVVHLTPEDFLTRNEKVWGKIPDPQIHPPLSRTVAASAEVIQAPKSRLIPQTSFSLFSQSKLDQTGQSLSIKETQLFSTQDCSDSIGMADSDSIVENQFYQPVETAPKNLMPTGRINEENIYEEVRRPIKFAPPPLSIPRSSPTSSFSNNICLSSNANSPTWHNADSDGETETVATDGLDNISDLTSLTDLLDKYCSRPLNLLQNRPSALESILTQFGCLSGHFNNTGGRNQSGGSGNYVALAAGNFNPDEDSHRNEFLALLSSPAAQGPVILTEYGFDQRRIGMDRNPKDGMLYIHCNNTSCPRIGPTRVDRASSWRTCTNCFTTYCSPKCREQSKAAHNIVCNFGRVRLICGRILHGLAPSQQASLTALARAGATRLGRGGILITFASVQDAEFFLARSAEQIRLQPSANSATLQGPSGLIAPPIYLTVDELNKLDSKLSAPCRIYKPSLSYVLIVIVCAYDLEMTKHGRAVHLYKQCAVLPFPVTTMAVQAGGSSASFQAGLLPEKKLKAPVMQSQTTKEEREAYSKRLQRTLRERGISLRNNEPEIYNRLSAFVETGEKFEPIEFDFQDYYSNQIITCVLAPMKDVAIRRKADFDRKALNEETHQPKICSKTKAHKKLRSRFGETEL